MEVTLFLNHQCNLRCAYCYTGEEFSRKMPEATMQRAIEMAFTGQDARLSFFGGEPLLEFELIEKAVAYARQLEAKTPGCPLRFSMTTNGTLLDPEKIAFFQKFYCAA